MLEVSVRTHVGMRRRVNEDRTAVFSRDDGRFLLAVVADGMGGHKGGDTASSMTVEGMEQDFSEADPSRFKSTAGRAGWLTETVERLNRSLLEHSRTHEECRGMGTTLEAAVIDGTDVTLCHIGDSRAYLIGRDDTKQLTRDHSLVNLLLESGEITEEEAINHPKRNFIMKALGTDEETEPDIVAAEIPAGSALLLCSDGLSNKLTAHEIAESVCSEGTADERTEALVRLANERGGEDNISVILIDNGVREGD